MNKSFFYILFFLVSVSCISAYNIGDTVPLSVHAQYDNGVSLVDILVPCRLSMFLHDSDSFVLRNVSMIPSGAFHTYSFIPSSAGSYTASIFCSYLGDSSVFWIDFDVGLVPVVPSSSGRGISNGSGSVLQSVLSGSIVPERSSFTVNKFVDSLLNFDTQYSVDNQLSSAKSSSYKLLKDGVIVDSGFLSSTAVGTYSFSYDFVSLPVGLYQVALSFDDKVVLVDVNVVSRSNALPLISGLITSDDGSVSAGKLGVFIFVLLFIVVASILLVRSFTRKPPQNNIPANNNFPRRGFDNR